MQDENRKGLRGDTEAREGEVRVKPYRDKKHSHQNNRINGRPARMGERGKEVTFEGEQQAIMSTRPLPFKPSYNSLVSVLSR